VKVGDLVYFKHSDCEEFVPGVHVIFIITECSSSPHKNKRFTVKSLSSPSEHKDVWPHHLSAISESS
jgi:predicted RNA-binding protein with PUA-like domain